MFFKPKPTPPAWQSSGTCTAWASAVGQWDAYSSEGRGRAEISREEHQLEIEAKETVITAAEANVQGLTSKQPKHQLYHALFTTALCSLPEHRQRRVPASNIQCSRQRAPAPAKVHQWPSAQVPAHEGDDEADAGVREVGGPFFGALAAPLFCFFLRRARGAETMSLLF